MKRICSISMIVLIIFNTLVLSSCNLSGKVDVHAVSQDIRLLMEEKTKSEDFWQVQISSTPPRSYEEDRQEYIANDYDYPIRCYEIKISDLDVAKSKLQFRDKSDEEHYNNLPDNLKKEIDDSYKSTFKIMQIIVYNIQTIDYSHYGMSTICNTEKLLENSKIDETAAYLYIFETGKPIIIIFGETGKRQVTAIGKFITNSQYKTLSETRDIFEPYGCSVNIAFEN